MANPSANTVLETRPRAGREAYIITNGTQLYAGALIGLLSTGYVGFWADGASDVFLGICLADALGDTTASPPVEARVDTEGRTVKGLTIGGTPTQAKVGDPVYSADGNITSLTLTIGVLNHPIGYMSRYTSATDVDVTFFTPTEMLAQREA